jgi:hypothetical protein
VGGSPKDIAFLQNSRLIGGVFPLSPKEMSDLMAKNRTATPGEATPTPQAIPTKLAGLSSVTVPWHLFFWAILFGIGMAFAIEALTDYYVSTHKRPVQEVAGVSSAGPAPMIIQGFAYALESSVFMVFAIVLALLFPLFPVQPGNLRDSHLELLRYRAGRSRSLDHDRLRTCDGYLRPDLRQRPRRLRDVG